MGKQRDENVQVEGLVIGGMTGGTVRIGGREVEIGPDGRPVEEYVKECDTCGEELVTDDPAILRHEGCDW